MGRTKKVVLVAIAAAAIVGGGGYTVFALLAGGSEAPAALPSASFQPASVLAGATPDGTWNLDASSSFVGYRVREKLSILPAPSDAVGRTTAVTGALSISGTRVTTVEVTADLTQLQSDRSMRDQRIHSVGLETDRFPDATFTLTKAIAFDTAPAQGAEVDVQATGTLTLHGVTKEVVFPLKARWAGDSIDVAGSLAMQFADFDIQAPNSGFVTTEDHGTIELQLHFTRANA
jgi:polyisoprenoid-binding protein YceI